MFGRATDAIDELAQVDVRGDGQQASLQRTLGRGKVGGC
jgi:hypothetical protein